MFLSFCFFFFFFFFSSRRRHTRWTGDWSSDVCSSDLERRSSAGRAWCSERPWLPAGPRSTSSRFSSPDSVPGSHRQARCPCTVRCSPTAIRLACVGGSARPTASLLESARRSALYWPEGSPPPPVEDPGGGGRL